ncbi:hypothetical protein DENSPDRAFT_878718 [Dentipellis sp. KUC8613]|nr:hypothetical protein DENSPDRAFT_878718 [Dentipellis sp. KUC8613]
MFEEDCCLHCGKPGLADGRIYCSDDCHSLDTSSPSISTASSALSSPILQPFSNPAADIPNLSLASMAIASSAKQPRHYQAQAYHYALSSSKSSLNGFWYEDDADDSDSPALVPDSDADDLPQPTPPVLPAALSYARRPSSTNTHSTIPLLHRRTSSAASPASLSAEDDSDASLPSHPHAHRRLSQPASHMLDLNLNLASASSPTPRPRQDTLKPFSMLTSTKPPVDTTAAAAKKHRARTRNRASLPAYFSLLQTGSSAAAHAKAGAGSVSVSLSPTTPTLAGPAVHGVHVLGVSAHTHTHAHAGAGAGSERERGRRRVQGLSSTRSRSRSRSRGGAELDGVRGRRRPHELDGGEREWGFGSGRSGLRERERERGRTRER